MAEPEDKSKRCRFEGRNFIGCFPMEIRLDQSALGLGRFVLADEHGQPCDAGVIYREERERRAPDGGTFTASSPLTWCPWCGEYIVGWAVVDKPTAGERLRRED